MKPDFMQKVLLTTGGVLIFGLNACAATSLEEKINSALVAPTRSDADRRRDANRLPAETLKFFGMRSDMRVLELIPGGGWYTRVLAPVLAREGKLYVALGTDRVKDGLLKEAGFENVALLEPDINSRRPEPRGLISIDEFDLPVTDLDLVLTFRNLHNFDKVSRDHINSAVFEALAPGGRYGVIDHTRRHMESSNAENRRRLDPVLVIHELESHGFEFVDFSDLHYRSNDSLKLEVGDESVSGKTDRFTLLFRRPAN